MKVKADSSVKSQDTSPQISGAGAEVTALAESLQAYACATRQFLGKDLIDVVDEFGRPAISGQGGNDAAFSMVCKLWRYCSDEQEVEKAFIHYNVTKCEPKFDENGMERIMILKKQILVSTSCYSKYLI